MFLRAASLLRLLNALLASTNKAASVSTFSKTVCMAWIAALMLAIWPAHSCTDPAALWMSSAMIDRIAFPMMCLRVSVTPIGCTPGFLFSAMSRHAIKLSTATGSTYSVHRCVVAATMASQSSSECRL